VQHRLGHAPDPAGPQTWDMAVWLGTTTEQTRKLVQDFNESDNFAYLNPCDGAFRTVWRLKSAGHTCGVLSACGKHHPVGKNRFYNLAFFFNRYGQRAFSEINLLPLGSSKFDWLYKFTRKCDPQSIVFVEDNFEHAKSGVANGITSYCLRRGHNRVDEANHVASSTVRWIDHISEVE
jgi:hypothetical protein